MMMQVRVGSNFMNKKYNAFLSHNSLDKTFEGKITPWLEDEANLSVWLDKWNLIPGDTWQGCKKNQTDICLFSGLNK
jgi:hypothetical protein